MELPALFSRWPETKKVMAGQTVAYASWDPRHAQLTVLLRAPDH
jgi:hypothetical protein